MATANYEKYIDSANRSIFRFEGLQDYSAMDGEDSVRAFIESGKLPFVSSETKWWQSMHQKNLSGVKTSRVRLVSLPLTDYTKMELALHRNSAEYSGEDIRIIEQAKFEKIFGSGALHDFYVIDDVLAFPMKYGSKGIFLGDEIVEGDRVLKYVGYKEKLLDASVPIVKWRHDL